MPHDKRITPWNIDLILAFQTGRQDSILIRSIFAADQDQFFFKKRHRLHFFEKMWICDQPHVYFFVLHSFIGHIGTHGIDMQTAVFMFLKETADDLRHKIKIQAVHICNLQNVRRFFILYLTCLQPKLLPFTRKRHKTLSCICEFQCAGTFFADNKFCSKFFLQSRQTMAQCRL